MNYAMLDYRDMKTKKARTPRTKRKILKRRALRISSSLILLFVLLPILLFTLTTSLAEAFFNGFQDFKPKSKTVLPADIQKAIQNEAVNELAQGYDYQHTDVVAQIDPQDMRI